MKKAEKSTLKAYYGAGKIINHFRISIRIGPHIVNTDIHIYLNYPTHADPLNNSAISNQSLVRLDQL